MSFHENNIFTESIPKILNEPVDQKEENTLDWNTNNIETLYNWLIIASYNIMILEASIATHRNIINIITLWGLFLSGSTGTISVSQITQTNNNIIFNFIFIFLSYSVTILTGYLKMYKIQDKLEEFIRVKQEWISFSTTIVSQMQLPMTLRQSAQDIILANKVKYLELLKLDLEIDEGIKQKVSLKITNYHLDLGEYLPKVRPRLTDIIMTVARKELSFSTLKDKLDQYSIEIDKTGSPTNKKVQSEEIPHSEFVENFIKISKLDANKFENYVEEDEEDE